MTLANMTLPRLLLSLRGHSLLISCGIFLGESLISADVSGTVYIWDLNTKRPRKTWKAHDSNIILLEIIGGTLITHSRDSSIRFWDINSSGIPPQYEEFPVNSLNFCNVSISSASVLLTPSTVDSNNFDIYKFEKVTTPDLKFSRLVHNVDPFQLYQRALKTLPFEIIDGGSDDVSKRDKFGIMMRTVWVNDSIFYIGYESGHVLGFHIDIPLSSASLTTTKTPTSTTTSLINKSTSVKLIHISDNLVPSPILSLTYNPKNNAIIAGSASKNILVLPIPNDTNILKEDIKVSLAESDCNIFLLKYSGLSQISVLENTICVGFWNGYVKGFDSETFQEQFKLEKNLPMINLNDENESRRLKLCTISTKDEIQVDYLVNMTQKEIIRARRDISSKSLLALGYENGLISLYEVSKQSTSAR